MKLRAPETVADLTNKLFKFISSVSFTGLRFSFCLELLPCRWCQGEAKALADEAASKAAAAPGNQELSEACAKAQKAYAAAKAR